LYQPFFDLNWLASKRPSAFRRSRVFCRLARAGAFGGFADDAKLERGYLPLSDRPGVGFEGQSALYSIMRALAA
jgi:hypothetical protein